jgi:type I phosphodiesterase/nucleotide pyrophosphatase
MRAVLMVMDGLRPDLVTPALLPRLARLAAEGGTRFAAARSVFPSETRVATASLLTGCRPGAHGLVANTLFDAAAAPDRLLKTNRVEDLRLLAGGDAPSPLQRPGLGEILAASGRSLAVVSAGSPGQTLLAHPLAEHLGAFRWNAEDHGTEAACLVAARLGPTPPAAVPNIPRVAHAARALTEVVLPELRPDVALFWCPEPDVSFHYRGLGAPEARAALAAADAALGRVLDWRDAQPDAAEIVVLVLSDHGHVTGHRKLDVAAELRRGGFAAGEGPEAEVVVAPAAAPGLWLRDPPRLAPALAGLLAAQDWAGPLLARDPAILPGVLPLSLLDAAHRRSADLVLCLAGEEGPDRFGLPGRAPFDAPDVPEGGGMHGGLHRRELATVLVAAGGPFRRGAAVRAACDLTDIAPTLLHLLGLPAAGMEGRVLAEGWDAAADAPPDADVVSMARGFALEVARRAGRLYPTALRCAGKEDSAGEGNSARPPPFSIG